MHTSRDASSGVFFDVNHIRQRKPNTMNCTKSNCPTISLPDNTTTPCANSKKDKRPRGLSFLYSLKRVLAVYLPEAPRQSPLEDTEECPDWCTIRVQPEIMMAIIALQERYADQYANAELSDSEVLSAALNEALPILTKREFKGLERR
jgi:hypothetical protein